MTYRHLILDLDHTRHVATVTLNKPERLNAIDQQDKVDLLDAIARIQADDDIWVADLDRRGTRLLQRRRPAGSAARRRR